jgi:hypothetical protein
MQWEHAGRCIVFLCKLFEHLRHGETAKPDGSNNAVGPHAQGCAPHTQLPTTLADPAERPSLRSSRSQHSWRRPENTAAMASRAYHSCRRIALACLLRAASSGQSAPAAITSGAGLKTLLPSRQQAHVAQCKSMNAAGAVSLRIACSWPLE